MSAYVIDGKAIAAATRAKVATRVKEIGAQHGVTPGLAVVLVGHDPASEIYITNKKKMAEAAGIRSFEYRLNEAISQDDLLALIARLNADASVHGILVQLPLPRQIDSRAIIAAVDPAKDVDGFHPVNAGRLAAGLPGLVPCTPLGCVMLAKSVHSSLSGANALVLGRSNIVGKPLGQLLLTEDATVTIAHSKSRDLAALCRRAELLFVAIGRAETVRGAWIRPGATVIDVGINRVAGADGKNRLVGDVAFNEACLVAGAITPVPGGVGPMTIACLLLNTLRAACAAAGLGATEV
jgi:methylenetetrahydrofolate dehydrogenase (NADP+)/methenyltetrahydrofolate cyclohydrolase